jgi:uncharacterized membrane protein
LPDSGRAVPEPAARNIEAIGALERSALQDRSWLDRVTTAVTAAAGHPLFLFSHAIWFAGWIGYNVIGDRPFDPYPFGLLMLIVALEAVLLTTAVLMKQNRMQRQAERRTHLDLQVNLLAEQELTTMLKMLAGICERLDVKIPAGRGSVDQLVKETDINTIASAIDREMDETTASSSAPAPRTPSLHRS